MLSLPRNSSLEFTVSGGFTTTSGSERPAVPRFFSRYGHDLCVSSSLRTRVVTHLCYCSLLFRTAHLPLVPVLCRLAHVHHHPFPHCCRVLRELLLYSSPGLRDQPGLRNRFFFQAEVVQIRHSFSAGLVGSPFSCAGSSGAIASLSRRSRLPCD